MINMPVEIIPPMYRMLGDEIKWAVNDVSSQGNYSTAADESSITQKEPYNFDHYIIFSRLYKLTAGDVDSMMEDVEDTAPPTKKQKKKAKISTQAGLPKPGTFPFHVEDETIQKVRPHMHATPQKHSCSLRHSFRFHLRL